MITQFIKAVVDVDGSSDVNFRYLIISCVIDPSQSSKIEKSAILENIKDTQSIDKRLKSNIFKGSTYKGASGLVN